MDEFSNEQTVSDVAQGELEKRMQQARAEYISAGVAEMNMVCNVIESQTQEIQDQRRQFAQLAGDNAQQKFESFQIAVGNLKDFLGIDVHVTEGLGGASIVDEAAKVVGDGV